MPKFFIQSLPQIISTYEYAELAGEAVFNAWRHLVLHDFAEGLTYAEFAANAEVYNCTAALRDHRNKFELPYGYQKGYISRADWWNPNAPVEAPWRIPYTFEEWEAICAGPEPDNNKTA